MIRTSARTISSRGGALLAGLALAGLSAVPAQAQTIYCATLGGQLFEMDIATGIATPLFSTSVNQLFGIANAGSPDELIVSGVVAGMFHVDVNSGITTPLAGSTTPQFAICNNEADGKIYGMSLGSLYEVDPATGAATQVSPTGTGGTGFLSVWGVDYHRGLQTLVGFSSITNELISIDAATGVGMAIGPTMPGLVGLWYDEVGDTLYGICDQNNQGCIVEIDATTGTATPLHTTGMNLVSIGGDMGAGGATPIGVNYCMAAANSTGTAGSMSAFGSSVAANNNVSLQASGLPANQFGIFVTSNMQAFVLGSGGTSNGNLCLGGMLGRFSGPGQILSTGTAGEFSLSVDTTQIPAGGIFDCDHGR